MTIRGAVEYRPVFALTVVPKTFAIEYPVRYN
ncbi:hypothetical protein SAMN05443507_10346 [Alicyclobacillus tolerans]|uniref:Uncharacterized protein n=1 Tax=Alicyclobacillus tolerans TaxID=90970 RepID=A0A1M6LQ83_9BACL|nr:hypothetical protein SAMN05443507_10346 [Alicyclobacillus montanus]